MSVGWFQPGTFPRWVRAICHSPKCVPFLACGFHVDSRPAMATAVTRSFPRKPAWRAASAATRAGVRFAARVPSPLPAGGCVAGLVMGVGHGGQLAGLEVEAGVDGTSSGSATFFPLAAASGVVSDDSGVGALRCTVVCTNGWSV
jgi:hypothetical protein